MGPTEQAEDATFLTKWHFNAQQIGRAYSRKDWVTAVKLALGTRSSVLFPYLKGLPQGSDVLEVGTGSGVYQYLLAHQLGFKTAGVEYDPQAMAEAQAMLTELGYPESAANLVQGSAEALPYEDSRFDGIYSNDVLAHVPNPEIAIAEMYRVLKYGGRLALHSETCGYYQARGSWQHQVMKRLGFDPWVELDLHISLKPGTEIIEMLKAAGFTIERTYYASESLLLFNFIGPRPDPFLYEKHPELLKDPLVKMSEAFRMFYETLHRIPGVRAIHQLALLAVMTFLTYTLPYDSNGIFVHARKPGQH
jgi:ubiquinone/menaquinone biosynthesis C-methylase UbiE